MSTTSWIYLYLVCIGAFLVIDLIWLGVVAKDMYRNSLDHLMAESTNWVAGISFYLLFVVGIVFFVVEPSLDNGSLISALATGFFFGFICYATYDLTNLATLQDWPLQLTLIDMVWGGVLSGVVAVIGRVFAKTILI